MVWWYFDEFILCRQLFCEEYLDIRTWTETFCSRGIDSGRWFQILLKINVFMPVFSIDLPIPILSLPLLWVVICWILRFFVWITQSLKSHLEHFNKVEKNKICRSLLKTPWVTLNIVFSLVPGSHVCDPAPLMCLYMQHLTSGNRNMLFSMLTLMPGFSFLPGNIRSKYPNSADS